MRKHTRIKNISFGTELGNNPNTNGSKAKILYNEIIIKILIFILHALVLSLFFPVTPL